MTSRVPYLAFHDDDAEDIGVNEDDISESGSEHTQEGDRARASATETHTAAPSTPHDIPRDIERRAQGYLDNNRWPKKIGFLHLVHGILLFILGLCQVILLPFLESNESNPLHLNKKNVYGVGIWTGILMGFSGCIALRATLHHSSKTISAFVILVLIEILVISGFLLMVVVGYTSKWTTPDAYNDSGALFGIHVAISSMIFIGYLLVLHAFTQYYEDVLFGEFQMCRKIVHCCMPCWCPRVVEPGELQDETAANRPPTERPPSLPI